MCWVAVGAGVTSRPPRRSRRAAFPHRAPVEGRTRPAFGAWAAHPVPGSGRREHASSGTVSGACVGPCPSFDPSLHALRHQPVGRCCSRFHRYYTASSYLPIRLRLLTFPNRPGIAVATAGGMRSPRFRRVPFGRNGVFDHGRAVAPRMTVRNMLPSTFSTVSAPANLYLSRLNNPLHTIAVYASPWSSPSTPQHSLPGDPLQSYPGRTSTGWNAPASPGAPKIYSNNAPFGPIPAGFRVARPLIG